jgi:hypothetical protein
MKCSACGFVSFATEEVCKKCKRNMFDPHADSNFDANAASFAGSNAGSNAASFAGSYPGSNAGAKTGAFPGSEASSYTNSYNSPSYAQPEKSISWGSVGFGLLMIGVAFFLYYTFDNLEREGGSVRMNVLFILLYNIGGKWLAAIVVALIGIGTMIAGFNGSSLDDKD